MRKFGFLQRRDKNSQNVYQGQETSLPKSRKGRGVIEKALVFHTDWTAEELDVEINDGKGKIGDKEFVLDQVRPFIIKGSGLFSKNKILYLLKWDKVKPCNYYLEDSFNPNYIEVGFKPNGNEMRQTLAPFDIKFGSQTGPYRDITPEILRSTFDQRYLAHMKKYSTEGSGGFKLGKGKGVIALILFILVFGVTTFISYSYLGGGLG